MTIQLTTNNIEEGHPSVESAGVNPPANFPDEATLSRMASEFFAALPNIGSASGLNLDLAQSQVGKPPHAPQPQESIAGLSGRAPNLAFQNSIHPQYPENIPIYPDYPERRAVSSAPIIGGANIPKVPYEPIIPTVEAERFKFETHVHNPNSSSFYFLDEIVPAQTENTERLSDPSELPGLPQGQELYIPDQKLNTDVNSAHTSFYFLDVPQPNTSSDSYSHLPKFTHQNAQPLDVHAIRRDFPILKEQVNGRPLVWFDNAATTQKPQAVIDRIAYFYQHENSNIHRAAHELAARATDAYEHARNVVARFIGAQSAKEIIFVRGTTEGINLIAKTWGEQNIEAGDEIIVSHLEHHANIVPWFQLSKKKGAKLRVIPVDDSGQIRLEELAKLINTRTKLVSITQVSNALGTVTPVDEVIKIAHSKGVRVLVDGAQSVSHMPTNVQAIDADFFVFSGHKVFGPTGIGAVYAKSELLETMPVWEGGGNMIEDVTFEQVIYQPAPNKFEAGTGNIADAVGLGAALEYVEQIGIHNIARYEHDLLEYGQHALSRVVGLHPIGTAKNKASVMSFVLDGYSTEQVGKALNQQGIAVRSGHHCAQPILRRFNVEQTVRPSLAFYNTTEEIDLMVSVLHQLVRYKRI